MSRGNVHWLLGSFLQWDLQDKMCVSTRYHNNPFILIDFLFIFYKIVIEIKV